MVDYLLSEKDSVPIVNNAKTENKANRLTIYFEFKIPKILYSVLTNPLVGNKARKRNNIKSCK